MTGLPQLRRPATDERGFTLTEMLVVLTILALIIPALVAIFVSALRTEIDQNQRFEAQQDARLALTKLRREIHCAGSAVVRDGGVASTTGNEVTLTSAASGNTGYCQAGESTWCAQAAATGFSLYRQAGAACGTSGVLVAEHLTGAQVFTKPPVLAGQRETLHVDLTVDVDQTDPRRDYRLFDEIVLRGSKR